jgi:long-chain acyl-CoA synthetase
MNIVERHIPEVFFKNAELHGPYPFLGYKEGGSWKTWSWGETRERVIALAQALIRLGIGKGDHVAIFSPNCPMWAVCDLATLSTGAIDVPIYATNSASECEYILNDSQCKVCFVGSPGHLQTILSIRARVPSLTHVVAMHAMAGDDSGGVLSSAATTALGEDTPQRQELEVRLKDLGPEDVATLIYTSGTTGPPKGVMLTQRNFLANVLQAEHSHPDIFEARKDIQLSFLPLSHSLERTAGWYLPMHYGCCIYHAESMLSVVDNMKELRPNFAVSVPRLFEKIHDGVHQKVAGASSLKRRLFSWAVGIGRRRLSCTLNNRPVPRLLALQHRLASRLVLSKIRVALGLDRIKVFVSGGAPLAPHIAEFFHALGVAVHEGYGLSETTPILTVNTFDSTRLGTVGKAVEETEIRIADDGEVVIRGPQVMKGYHNQPEATREVLDRDGWFHTGDIGALEDGFLRITDRKKNIIITAGGKNVSPQNIETALLARPHVGQAVVIGDRRPCLTALIVPSFETLEPWAKAQGIACASREELLIHPRVLGAFDQALSDVNRELGRVEQVKRYTLLAREFAQATGELTPTLKIRRKVVLEMYARQIEAMYGPPKG